MTDQEAAAPLDATTEAAIAKFQAAFNELMQDGHDPQAVAQALITTGLGAILQLEGAGRVAELLATMSATIAADATRTTGASRH